MSAAALAAVVAGAVTAGPAASAAPAAPQARLAAAGSLPGCTRAATTTFPRSGILENPSSPRTAGWSVSGTWGNNVNGGLCLETVRMYVHDSTDALRTWEVIAGGKVVASASFRTGPGYHYWTFSPDRKLGRITSLCVAVTVPESPGHPGALAARSCYSIGWLA